MNFSEMVRLGVTFKKITDRGTNTIISKLTFINWASEEFRQFQTRRLSLISSNFIIHVGRGIRTMKINDLPKYQKLPNIKGRIIVVNRGTKSKKL
jgi:hypothetical protein